MSSQPQGRRVAIVGAGPGGLTVAKSLLEEGFEPTVFEQSQAVGGQWNLHAPHSGIWPGMRTNTSKTLTTFSDFPPPDDWSMFPRAEQVQAHHAVYAERFGVTPRIRFGAAVRGVEQADSRYDVSWTDASGTHTDRFDAVVVASGRYNRPRLPEIEGLDRFTGRGGVRHSFDYAGRAEFLGHRVVVLGNAISGPEIASDLAIDDSTTVYAAFRKPRYMLPRVAVGVPSDWRFFTRVAAYLPLALPMEEVGAGFKQQVLAVAGHPGQYGAPAPHDDLFVANVGMCQDWLSHVAHGRLHPRPTIARVDGNVVTFADGATAEVDTIICATGYELHLPFLSRPILDTAGADTTTLDLYHHTFHPDLPGLAFVGLYHLVGPYAPVVELQGRWIAMVWAGARSLSEEAALRAGIAQWRQQRQLTDQVFLHDLAITLASDAGVLPQLDTRPEITRALLFGPLAPAQFRLDGRGSQPEALDRYKQAIAAFAGDVSPAPTPEQLGLVTMLADKLGSQMPDLVRARDTLQRLAAA
jgi:dimethylaniline monooxygenase (N-oxide forming)